MVRRRGRLVADGYSSCGEKDRDSQETEREDDRDVRVPSAGTARIWLVRSEALRHLAVFADYLSLRFAVVQGRY